MRRILIIDKNKAVRISLRQQLEKGGYDVIEREEGQKGIEFYRKSPTDLVITDIHAPELEGLRTIIQMRKEFPGVIIIAKSTPNIEPGYIRYDPLQSAKLFGALRTVSSPINMEGLIKVIEELATHPVPVHRRSTRHLKFKARTTPNP
jgi:two-component system, chemotaxis family, chemotaxis protein CheY